MSALAPREVVQARWIFALLAAQFWLPAASYVISPATALRTVDQVGQALGGAPYAASEHLGHLWHMLAVGNVATLGFACTLLAFDLRRFHGVLPVLLFLKGFSACFSLAQGLTGGPRFFLAVALLDGVTTGLMAWAGRRALAALGRP